MTDWITADFTQRLAGSLLHFFWEGAAVAMLAAAALRLFGRRSAEARYTISVGAMLLMVAAPLLTFVFYAQTGAATLRLLQFVGDALTQSANVTTEGGSVQSWTRWIVLAWLTGVLVCTARLTAGWQLSRRLLRSADGVVPAALLATFEQIKDRLSFSKPVRLLLSARIDTPAVVGWLRPAILLPVTALTGLSEEQLRAVLAHELAHIRRHDFLVNVLQRFVESILFYHPAVWWLSARIRTERENCCDDLAVQVCGDRLLYAQALIELERTRPETPVLSVAATGGSLVMRVRRILGRETVSADWQSAVAALAFVVVWVIAGAWQSPSVQAGPIAVPVRSLALLASILPTPAPVTAPGPAFESIVAILTAQPLPLIPAEPLRAPIVAPQSGGTIEGSVLQVGSSSPISNAQVTLSGGAINTESLENMAESLWATAQVPQDAFLASIRNYYTGRGMTQQAANGEIEKIMVNGIPAGDNTAFEDGIVGGLMSYVNNNFGISPFNPEFGAAIKKFQATTSAFKVVTDRSGRFSFRDVPPGQYTVRVVRDGFYARDGANSTVPQTGTAKVTVVAGRPSTVDVSMVRGATISGHVRDERGQPLANTTIQAFAVTYTNGWPSFRAVASNKTNDRGEYSIFWLPGGEYCIATVKASTQIVGAGSLLQQVVGTFYPGTSDLTGAVMIPVKAGRDVEGIDLVDRVIRPFKVSGTVRATLPAPDPAAQAARGRGNQTSRQAVLMLMQRNPNAPDDVGARQVAAIPVDIASGTGNFEVELSPGSYDLFARMPTPGGVVNVSFGRASFDVRNEPVKELVINVDPVPSLSGILTVNGAAPGQTSIKVSVQVDDSAAKFPAYGINIRARTVPVNADGSFAIPAVFQGHWQVYIEGLAPNMYVADVRQGGRSVFDSGMDIRTGPQNPIEVLVRNDSGTVQGVVLDLEKKPFTKAQVVVVPQESRRQNRLLFRPGTTDANGRFTITGVGPGTYKVFALPDSSGGPLAVPISGNYYNPKYLSKYEALGRPVTVTQSSSVEVELTAPPLD